MTTGKREDVKNSEWYKSLSEEDRMNYEAWKQAEWEDSIEYYYLCHDQ